MASTTAETIIKNDTTTSVMLEGHPVTPTKELIERLSDIAILAGGVAVVETWDPSNTQYGDDHAKTVGTLIPGRLPNGVDPALTDLYEEHFIVWPDKTRPGDRDSQGITGSLAAPRSVPYAGNQYVLRFLGVVDAENKALEAKQIY
jgi:hypothetical protein